MRDALINLAYVVSAILFIFGLKYMSHPRTAVKGNLISAGAMLLAVVLTLTAIGMVGTYVIAGLVIGGIIGVVLAVKVQMTEMPQLVALFNGFGGAATVFVAGAELLKPDTSTAPDVMLAAALSGLIGAVTFWGSLVAYGKLQELKMFKKPINIPSGAVVNGVMVMILLLLTIFMAGSNWSVLPYILIVIIASILGFTLVVPIGGADMPVVIALLNSYSGLAAAATGFVIDNNVLIISGSLVGASGIILTQIMCKAMNRSLTNVVFGGLQSAAAASGPAADEVYANVRSTSADDIAMILDAAQRVVVVPGYGLAVAQAQHAVRDMATVLEDRGINVEYAIHPVAGRMPGHMNVLLAEADIPYEKLREMDDINPTMGQVDVAIVLGANDVVNPVANTDPNSPIAGMPIINVDKARTVIVIKRSLSPGFAGIPNPLFAADNTLMFFADGKEAILDIITAIKENA
ncbi:NAD(P)(+) transhydrogenase (Re/Si-specific) subunit beta [Blastopirellula sp. JC732]|uniref:NAD(P) transhydrogenase subunit beta n=1 Tax=Blastopirellula sediminis TaxID=2894196 RepID=A0A9X1MI30_9BACT|nr:NAD(P)(+) transhydrogenase (Re/Si-specific) subunit beta [Blastopirellula sediminis]MCC9609711.1 NAD(P)(+) transhydrogenase (Re/Si-specific) subunit beta [Blastopirellula sediminis]MCC9627513.1 NAD(P)(+) transhydrogenase (Re/Si-specific) subunit beta [Blastopirellula sediminis]